MGFHAEKIGGKHEKNRLIYYTLSTYDPNESKKQETDADTLNNLPHSKTISAEEAIAGIQPGSHVFVGTACATPRTLVKALEESKEKPF